MIKSFPNSLMIPMIAILSHREWRGRLRRNFGGKEEGKKDGGRKSGRKVIGREGGK